MFMGFDFSFLLMAIMVLFSTMIFMGGFYIYIVAGLMLVSFMLFLIMFMNGSVFFGFLFMLVYSGSMLLLIMYISAMLSDVEIKNSSSLQYYLLYFYFLLCGCGYLTNFYPANNLSVIFSAGSYYLYFALLLLAISLFVVLYSLLKKYV